jgi:hypothetical protein
VFSNACILLLIWMIDKPQGEKVSLIQIQSDPKMKALFEALSEEQLTYLTKEGMARREHKSNVVKFGRGRTLSGMRTVDAIHVEVSVKYFFIMHLNLGQLNKLYHRTGIIGSAVFVRSTAETVFNPVWVSGCDNVYEYFPLEQRTTVGTLAQKMDLWVVNRFGGMSIVSIC